MKKKIILIFMIVLLVSIPLAAETMPKTITAQLKLQKVNFKQKNLNKAVIIYEGKTYVPLKVFGNMLGMSVTFKEDYVEIIKVPAEADSKQTLVSDTIKPQPVKALLKQQRYANEYVTGSASMIEYEGVTYIQLEEFGRLVYATISKKKFVIYLGEADSSASSIRKSHNNSKPIPFGTTQTVTTNYPLVNCTAKIRIDEVLRGDEALNILQESESFQEAPEGQEYIAVKISLEVISVNDDKVVRISSNGTNHDGKIDISYGNFWSYNSKNEKCQPALTRAPEPAFRGELSAGEMLEGWGVYMADQSDKEIKLLFGQDSQTGEGGVWFSLQ